MPGTTIKTRTSGIMVPAFVEPVTAGYQGPADIIASPRAWWGFRAMSAAKAAAGVAAIRVYDTVSTAEQDINVLSTGAIDEAAIVTFLGGHAGAVRKLYDQTGNGFDLNAAAPGSSISLQLVSGSPLTGHSVMVCNTSATDELKTSGNFTQTQPFTMSQVANRFTNTTSFVEGIGSFTSQIGPGWNNSANQAMTFGGTVLAGAASDNAFHSFGYFYTTSPNSKLVVDGSVAATGDAGTGDFSAELIVIPRASLVGFYWVEAGIWSGDQTASLAALSTQQHTYWGF